MKARLTVLLILMLVALTSGCGTPKTNHMAVRDAFEEAIEAGDLDAALALFTDDAVVMSSIGHYRGKEEIREALKIELDLVEAMPYGERLNVEETEDTLNYDERFLDETGRTVQLHHAYVFESGKIKEWAISDFHTVE